MLRAGGPRVPLVAWKTMSWSRFRRLIQILVLAAFAWLTVGGPSLGRAWLPTGPLSRLDPLVGLSAVLASRGFVAFWAVALLTIALTVVFGRVWCGWICPLGTVLEIVPLPAKLHRSVPRSWRLGKYVTLAIVLGAALIGNLGPMILDPVTIVTRPLQELARPFIGSDAIGQSIGASLGWDALHAVALLSLLPLVVVLALNLVGRRFWCRNLCPLGGLLALVSKAPGVRRRVQTDACISCARCAMVCPTGAITREEGFASSTAECITCLSCVDACKAGADGFAFSASQVLAPGYEPSRRDALVAMGATGLCLAAGVLPIARTHAEILRPPSTSEERLAELCVRCGACYGACPTGSLRPSVSFTSEAGPWTPMLDERLAHCTLKCNRCAAPCPTDALHTPTPQEAKALGLGVKAEVDRARCRAWARNHTCMQCQRVCPIAGALVGEERPAGLPSPNGDEPVQVPVVDKNLCVGCNLCATACVMAPAAIGAPLPRTGAATPATSGMPFRMPGLRSMPRAPSTGKGAPKPK